MKLIIAEKSSLAKLVAKSLSKLHSAEIKKEKMYYKIDDYAVVPLRGHFLELCEPHEYDERYKSWLPSTLPIFPEKFKLRPIIKKGASEPEKQIVATLKALRGLMSEAEYVIHAGDCDREGQIIVDEMLQYLRCNKPVKRLWHSEETETEVIKALGNLEDNSEGFYKRLSQSAETRRDCDWLVGINFTRAYTIKHRYDNRGSKERSDKPSSVGRVQTIALYLLYLRELELKNFEEIEYFGLSALLKNDGLEFSCKWDDGLEDGKYLTDKAVVDDLHKRLESESSATVLEFEEEEVDKSQPLLFTMTDFLSEAGKKSLNYDAAVKALQSLYEKGYVSYPRTSCRYFSEETHSKAALILDAVKETIGDDDMSSELLQKAEGADVSIKSRAVNTKEVAKEAHDGIRPTLTAGDFDDFTREEKLAYQVIATRFICQFYPKFKFISQKAVFDIGGERFKASGRKIIDKGFMVVAGELKPSVDLSFLSAGNEVAIKSIDVNEGVTKPPSRYNKASLAKKMSTIYTEIIIPSGASEEEREELTALRQLLSSGDGIGTESSRPNIIKTLMKRGYALVNKKDQFIVTEHGMTFIPVVSDELKSFSTTGIWERALKGIQLGDVSRAEFIGDLKSFITEQLSEVLEGIDEKDMSGPTDKMIGLAEKLSERHGVELPDEARKSSSLCKKFIDNYVEKSANPSEKQLALAEKIAKLLEIDIPKPALTDNKVTKAFIDDNIDAYKKRMGDKQPSDAMILLMEKLSSKHSVEVPEEARKKMSAARKFIETYKDKE